VQAPRRQVAHLGNAKGKQKTTAREDAMLTLINMPQTFRPVAEANALAAELNKNDDFTFVVVEFGNGWARIDVYSDGDDIPVGTW
jgi:hypothetical protein